MSSSPYYSRIRISFTSKNGYLYDLGTGLSQYAEVGCFFLAGLTTNKKQKPYCYIDLAYDSEDMPAILVENYDKVSATTTINIAVLDI